MSAQLSARAALEQCLSEIDQAASTCLSQTDFFANTLRTLNPLGISRLVVARKVENNPIYAITASRQLAAGSQNCDSFSVSIETPLDTNTETLIAKVIASNQPLIEIASIAPHNTTNGTVETPDTVFAIPFEPALSCSSVLLIECMSSQLVAEPAAYLQLLAALTESLNRFEYRQTVAELKSQLAASDRFAAFSRRAHQCLSQNRTAVTIANDGRAIVGCERLAVVHSSKGKCRVLAISGAEHIHRLSPTCSQLVQLCNRIIATRTEFRHPNPEIELPPELEAALDDYLEVSPALELTIIPLVAPDDLSPPIGALVFEQFQQPLPSDAKPLLPKLAEHARLALTNATTFESIPGHNWLIAITSRPLVRRLRFGTGMFLGVVTMLALALMLIPAELRLKARGELLPATRQEVFAPLDGIVSTIHVEHGQQVKPGNSSSNSVPKISNSTFNKSKAN